MSDNWIIVVPAQHDFVPSSDARRKAVELFRSIAPNAEDVREEATQEVRFIDCGANFERVVCPNCRAELEGAWWQARMNEEARLRFPLRRSALPCCGASRSLAELQYHWPMAFARFSVEARNPSISDLTVAQIRAFESVLGCRVCKVFRHI